MKRRVWASVVISAVVFVVALEAALRLIGLGNPPIAVRDTELEYRLVPNAVYHRWGNRIEIGDHGFRSETLPDLPRDNELRLLLIGDSVVYGNHFLDQDETISSRLAGLLSTPSCKVRVIPMAVSSWGPMNQAAALERHGTFGASEIAIVLSGHDLFDTPLENGSLVPYRLSEPIGAIGDAIEAVFERYFHATTSHSLPPFEERVKLSLEALDEIADKITSSNIELRLVYNATTQERRAGISDLGIRIFDWAHSRGVASLDLGGVQGIGYRDHIHPNADGALRIAEALAEWYSDRLVCE